MQTNQRKFGFKFIDFEELYQRDGGRCKICGNLVKRGEVVFDHIIPKGALKDYIWDPLASNPINAQIAHRLCNASRGMTGSAQIRLF